MIGRLLMSSDGVGMSEHPTHIAGARYGKRCITHSWVRRRRRDLLSGTPRAHSIDRWIFVFTAVWFIAIVLIGFVPDLVMKVAAVRAAQRPPFPTGPARSCGADGVLPAAVA